MKDIVLVYETGNAGFMICQDQFVQQISESLKEAFEKKAPTFIAYDEKGQIVALFDLKNYRGFYIREHSEGILPNDLIELQKACLKKHIEEAHEGEEWIERG